MGFSAEIAEKALLDCCRCCCICHKFCSFKIELHHIIQKSAGGEDSYENCIPLCFDCHAEIKAYDPKHPKGRKYTESEIREHRNRWYEKVNSQTVLIHPDCIELDRKLFLKIRSILPSTGGSISFIRNHTYGTRFLREEHDDLKNYKYQCENPDFEFIDLDLEIRKCQLKNCIEEFFLILFQVIFVTENGMMAIYPEIKYSKPDIHHKAVEDVNQAVNKVCSAYDDLIRLGRRKLGVE
ncbi:HNH endonuclease [Dolichospermum sp. LEGE 00240]|uniref:HNH endonuclease n=1 Tax=Dolichospermum sp. LEGE 00240 TaxID=1828603 RepID=UPI0018805AF6|nr:HNH endonuclease signature motif containing protein [Dolichospermum sp. LEGE 00240]MBE9249438.1 HNH endonuclease [Dolichospermum sp. LEGE 00240]MDM3846512.1 HNH endonuclease signature motif containing protein [Aphanizomenon gracile PMC638.10]MDM3852793.1 HNH endonuclease signature motif containing protein [Aphanizomenon gracile PMC627.10]